MRRTVASLIPISAAIVRVLQWVALAGLSCVVRRITSSLSLAEIVGLRPGRGASFSRPVRSNCKNRFRQRAAFWLLIFRLAAISKSVLPSAAKRTTLARSTCRAGRERDRAHCCRVSRCDGLMMTGGATRIGRLLNYRDVPETIFVTIYDALH